MRSYDTDPLKNRMGAVVAVGGRLQMTKIKAPKPVLAKRLFTLSEASDYLAVGVWKLRRLIWTGEIPCVQDAKAARILLDVHDLDRWVEAHKQKF